MAEEEEIRMLDFMGNLIALAFTLMILSFTLYKENPFYRFAEYTAVAVSLGNGVVVAILYIKSTFVEPSVRGTANPAYLFLVIFAALLFFQYREQYRWLSRYPLAIIVGVGMAIALRTSLETEVFKQVWATMLPLVGGKYTMFDNLLTISITLITMLYFLMTRKYAGKLSFVPMVTRWFLMINFGANLATRIPMYLAWATGRIEFILKFFGLI
ncbi:MAG: hypothetical protein QW486_00860 [Candidatus Bathyarchaeia archaeon]